MNDLAKVLVVDDGDRSTVDALSVELAELGVSSVTTSLEAAPEVLELLAPPSMIFLKMPRSRTTEYHAFLVLADQLKRGERTAGIPVVMWDAAREQDGLAAVFDRTSPPQAAAQS